MAKVNVGRVVGSTIIVKTTQPTARDDGSALLSGDVWIEPTSGNYYTYTGSAWPSSPAGTVKGPKGDKGDKGDPGTVSSNSLPVTFGTGDKQVELTEDAGIKATNAAFFYQIPASNWSIVTPAEDAFVGLKAQAGFLSFVMAGKFTLQQQWDTNLEKWFINIGSSVLPTWVRDNIRRASDFDSANRTNTVAENVIATFQFLKAGESTRTTKIGQFRMRLRYYWNEGQEDNGTYQIYLRFIAPAGDTAPVFEAGDTFYANFRVLLDVMAGNSASEAAAALSAGGGN